MKPLFKPSDMNKRAEFIVLEQSINKLNGRPTNTPVVKFTKWCGQRRFSLNQQISNMIDQKQVLLIGIKHDSRINKTFHVRLDGVLYDITAIESDVTNNYVKFDLLTLSKKEGH